VTLTARFEGLVKYLGTTKNAYLDLINAMGQYRGEESRLLSSSYFGQVAVQQKQNNLDQNSLNSTVAAIKADPNLMAKLTPQEKSALNNPNDLNFPRRMAEAADRIGAAADKLNDAATYSSRLAIGRREVERDKQQGGQALAASTGLGQQVTEKSQDFSTRLDALSTLTQGDRTKAGGALTNDINSFIGQLNARLPATSGAGKQFVQDAINTLRGLLNQVAAAIKPSQEEIKQAKADAAEQRRQEAELRKRPLIQQSDIDSVGQALGLTLGRGNDSSPAAKARENALHARGLTPATGDTSAHTITGGVARDFGVQGLSDAQANRMAATIRAQLQAMGIDALVQFETGVGKNQGTGRHIHVSVRPGTRFSKDKTDQQADAYDADLSAAQTTLDQSDLTKKLKDVSKATTTGTFNAAVQAATDALTKVNADIKNQALDELAAKGFGPNSPQYQARMQQVDQEIAQNVADFQQKIADNINKSVEKQLTAADRAFELATSSANANLKLAQGQVTGLDAYSLRNKVPDYTKQLAQDRAAQAQEALDRATQAALPARIASVQGALTSAQDKLGTLTDPTAIASVNDEITKLTTQLKDLQATKDALDAQLGADGLIPKTWTDAINQAATAFEHANGASNTFAQDLQMSLGGALQNVSDGLATMFTNILDGSQTALQAFGNFAKGIIQYMLQIVAKAAATKILSLLFNLVGIGAAGAGGSGGWSTASGSIGGGGGAVMTFEGGRIGDPDLPIERLKGGEVTNGSPTADSVRTKLAMGEWVVQKKAVDSVGNQFMARLNQHGAKALDTLGSMPSIDMKNHTETNVYVVPPEQKPTLSKNDVLVIMNDDMMNGDSKRLIQHIAKDS
jgi:hypothetical protein